jgi:hypothetical protein
MVPDNLRTGFGGPTDGGEIDPSILELQKRLVSIVVLMIEYSLDRAAMYADHTGIQLVDAKLIKSALKVEAMKFFDRHDLETVLEETCHELFEAEDDDDEDLEDLEDIEGDEDDDNGDDDDCGGDEELDQEHLDRLDKTVDRMEEDGADVMDGADGADDPSLSLPTKTCACEHCRELDGVDDAWRAWDVEDDVVKAFLKKHIEELDLEHPTEINI